MCGEKSSSTALKSSPLGSPPRMRGKEQFETGFCCATGITPAYAGKRLCCSFRLAKLGDHPRVCGEKLPIETASTEILGSPPRMRGKVYFCRQLFTGYTDHPRVCGEKFQIIRAQIVRRGSPPRMRGKAGFPPGTFCHVGITPAYAGKRPACTRLRACTWDHPRVCGEKGRLVRLLGAWLGSPPRMRGKACVGLIRLCKPRITPAYAGKSHQQ